MKIAVFASGSGGNCMLVSENGTHILIDAGISMRRIEASLQKAGLSAGEIHGVFITHEHSDHVSGLKMLLKHYDVPVFAPHTVASRLAGAIPELYGRIHIIPVGESIAVGALRMRAFHTPHDTDESVGYRVEGAYTFALATDMGHVTEEIRSALLGAGTVLIESNHDEEMLRYGAYPVYLKRRILSERGHLSNTECARLAAYLAENGTERIILGHLSRENNRPEIAERESAEALCGTGAELYCAPPFGYLCFDTEEMGCCL